VSCTDWALSRPYDEREAIATAGQQPTLKEHRYNYRMQELVEMVTSLLRR
jgi:spore maturation protein CgeB